MHVEMDVAANVGLYVPAGQVAHAADWLAALKVPAAQGVQAAAPEEEKEPGGQAAHAKAETAPGVAEKVPAGQAFCVAEQDPAGQ